MSATGASYRTAVCITVIVLLTVSAQFQRFLQSYKDESAATFQPASPSQSPSKARKEFIGDFQVYYIASFVVRHEPDHRLYYPQPGGQIFMDNVPQQTPWGEAARSAGFNSTMPFNYPPFAAVFLEPLSVLKWAPALLVWRVVLVGVVLLSVYFSVLLTGLDYRWLKFGLAAVAAFSFFPLIETLLEGQIDPFILLFWVLGIYLFEKGRSVESAFVFALGTVLKLSPAMVIGLFLLRRRWKWLASYALSLAVLCAVSVWRLGWSNHVIFVREVMPKLSCGMALLGNRSLPGLIYDIGLHRVPLEAGPLPSAALCSLVKVIGLVLYIGSLFLLWRRNQTKSLPVYEFMPLALLTLLISPVSWRHHYLLALLPLIYLWSYDVRRRFDLAVLAIATLSIGTVFADYLITAVHNPALDLALVSLTPLSTLFLLWVARRDQCAAAMDAEGVVSAASSSRSF